METSKNRINSCRVAYRSVIALSAETKGGDHVVLVMKIMFPERVLLKVVELVLVHHW